MPDSKPSFIENVNKISQNLNTIIKSIDLFDDNVVDRLEQLAELDISLITQDLDKGNYLGNRKIDIDLALNNTSEIEEVSYSGAKLTLNDGTEVDIHFSTFDTDGNEIIEEITSYTALYTKITQGIDAYNATQVDVQKHIVNYEIDVINETIEALPTLLRIRDVDGSACNIDRVVLSVYGGGLPVESNPSYFWTKTTSSLQVLANRVGDIIQLGNNIDKIIALSDKEDEIAYLYDTRSDLQALSNELITIINLNANMPIVTRVNANIDNINTANSFEDEIKDVVEIKSEVVAVDANKTDISNVSLNIAKVKDVSNNKANIDKVANNEPNINSVVANLSDITTALQNAQTASTKAAEASAYADDAKAYRDELTGVSAQALSVSSSTPASANYNSNNGVLTFAIPQGVKGDRGEAFTVNASGTIDNRSTYDDQSPPFAYLSLDESPTQIYFKKTDTSGDWTDGVAFGKGDKGDKGDKGEGILSIVRTDGDGSSGTIDTYTITFTDNTTTTFTVKNGDDGAVMSVAGKTGDVTLTKADVGLSDVDNTSDAEKPISNATQTALNDKEPKDTTILKSANIGIDVQAYNADTVVDAGYVHTDNNYTTTEKNKLSDVEENANNYVHPDTHPISKISGLQSALDDKVDNSRVLTDVPSGATFTDTWRDISDSVTSTSSEVGASSKAVKTAYDMATSKQPYNADTVIDAEYVHTDNNYTTTEKNKLSDVEENANNYVHPSTHDMSMISGLGDALADKADTSSVYTQAQIDSKLTEGAGGGVNADKFDGFESEQSLLYKGDIPDNVDLNDYIIAGLYHQNSSSQAANGSNYPRGAAGMLEVVNDGKMVYQTYKLYGNYKTIYYRTKYDDTWYPWSEIANTHSTVDNAVHLNGLVLTAGGDADTVVRRNSSGDISTRLFRSEYTAANETINYIMTQREVGDSSDKDNYMRPSTPSQLVAALPAADILDKIKTVAEESLLFKEILPDSSDLNDYIVSGIYELENGEGVSNRPDSNETGILIVIYYESKEFVYQIFYTYSSEKTYERRRGSDGTWYSWKLNIKKSDLSEIGVNQSLIDETSNRDKGIAVQNQTGKPIEITVTIIGTGNHNAFASLLVNDKKVSMSRVDIDGAYIMPVFNKIIQDGETYEFSGDTDYYNIYSWYELR